MMSESNIMSTSYHAVCRSELADVENVDDGPHLVNSPQIVAHLQPRADAESILCERWVQSRGVIGHAVVSAQAEEAALQRHIADRRRHVLDRLHARASPARGGGGQSEEQQRGTAEQRHGILQAGALQPSAN